jgi:tagatose kinase
MKSILTIGEILVEIMATDTGDGFLEPVKLVGPFPSGAPAIFIDQAAKFGQPAAIIGCVGNDDFGRVNLDRLRRDGVNVEGIPMDRAPSCTTSSIARQAILSSTPRPEAFWTAATTFM